MSTAHAGVAARAAAPAVPVARSRSWLLVAADRPEAVRAAAAAEADAVIYDIEDSVLPAAKEGARGLALAALREHAGWVRINDVQTAFWADDLAALHDADGLLGVVLAKTESADDVAATAALLPPNTPVVALVESALGVEDASAIARHPATVRLAFGTGDFRRDLGIGMDPVALAYPRSRLVISSRAAGLPGPIDGPSLSADTETVAAETHAGATLGLTGKLCLKPAQVQTVNESLLPSTAEVLAARKLLAKHAADGGAVYDGSDLPRLASARRVDDLARAFGR